LGKGIKLLLHGAFPRADSKVAQIESNWLATPKKQEELYKNQTEQNPQPDAAPSAPVGTGGCGTLQRTLRKKVNPLTPLTSFAKGQLHCGQSIWKPSSSLNKVAAFAGWI